MTHYHLMVTQYLSSDALGSLTLSGEGGSSATTDMDASAAGNIWDTFDGARGAVTAVAQSDTGPGDNSLLYTLPELMEGLSVKASYQYKVLTENQQLVTL